MRIVTFNEQGLPETEGIGDGAILVLFTQKNAEVVKLELLPPEVGGPCLTPALNWDKLEDRVMQQIRTHHPECLGADHHFTFECPIDIASDASF